MGGEKRVDDAINKAVTGAEAGRQGACRGPDGHRRDPAGTAWET